MQDGYVGTPSNIFSSGQPGSDGGAEASVRGVGARRGLGAAADVQSLAWDDFERADEAIEAGAAAARSALPRIQKWLARAESMREFEPREQMQLRLAGAGRCDECA